MFLVNFYLQDTGRIGNERVCKSGVEELERGKICELSLPTSGRSSDFILHVIESYQKVLIKGVSRFVLKVTFTVMMRMAY